MDQDIDVAQKTGTRVSAAVGLAIISFAGIGAAAGFLFFGSSIKQPATLSSTTIQTTSTTTPTTLTNTTLPPKEALTTIAVPTVPPPDYPISVVITSPSEGAAVNGATPVTVSLTDVNHKVSGVQIRLYGKMLPDYLQGTGSYVLSSPPYTFNLGYGMYPSGEYLYVAQALDSTGKVLAQSDTMVTWVRSCYWLAYQDMTLTAPTTSVTSGSSFTMTATVLNHQRGACEHKYIVDTKDPLSLNSLLPSGWTATVSPLTIDPANSIYGLPIGIEQSKTFTITVQVPSSVTTGTYQVGASSQLINTGFIVTKNANVSVVAPSGGGSGGEGIIIPKKVQ